MKYETDEMKREREEKQKRISDRINAGRIKKLSKTTVAYNVNDTSEEKPDISGINGWDEYWKYYTEENFTDQKCASCGCSLDASNRVGAHIRLVGEEDDTQDAWIALYCKSCNNSREVQKVRNGSLIVKTKMTSKHPNVPTLDDEIDKILNSDLLD